MKRNLPKYVTAIAAGISILLISTEILDSLPLSKVPEQISSQANEIMTQN